MSDRPRGWLLAYVAMNVVGAVLACVGLVVIGDPPLRLTLMVIAPLALLTAVGFWVKSRRALLGQGLIGAVVVIAGLQQAIAMDRPWTMVFGGVCMLCGLVPMADELNQQS